MQVVERTHHIDVIINSGAESILPLIREKYPEAKVVYDDDDELVEVCETGWFKETEKRLEENPGLRLDAYRWRAGAMTQKRLAELSGVSRETISRIENGRVPMTLSVAKKLAPHLGVDYRKLI